VGVLHGVLLLMFVGSEYNWFCLPVVCWHQFITSVQVWLTRFSE
jgi:hypothetical protein